MSSWTLVTYEGDTAQFLRSTGEDGYKPLTSPRFDELDAATKKQVKAAVATLRGLLKASGVITAGNSRISAAGYKHHDEKMPLDPGQAEFVALHIGRVV